MAISSLKRPLAVTMVVASTGFAVITALQASPLGDEFQVNYER